MANYIVKEHNGSDSTDGRAKSTIAVWVKRSRTGIEEHIWSWGENNSSDSRLKFQADDTLRFHSDGTGGGATTHITTTQLFRDLNGWYHFVLALDGSNGTEAYRRRLWINGVEFVHGVGSNTFSAAVMGHNSTQDLFIGDNARLQQNGSNAKPFIGYMSHFHYCDGYAYTASDFGEFDATTGEWKAKTSPSVTYGTHGIFLKMEDSSNMDLDSSPNASSQLSTTGTILPSEDCPSHVYATFNPLSNNDANGNFTHGNTSNNTGASAWRTMFSTLGASKGKFYCEMKYESGSNQMFGIISLDKKSATENIGYVGDSNCGTQAVGLAKPGDYYINGSSSTYTGGSNTSWTTGDIIQIALDRDNSKVYFGKNGTWMGSGDPTSGSTGTGAISFSPDAGSSWGFSTSVYASTSSTNFGNGYFQTTAVSSAGTNASGNGIFEYDVPAGFTALSTKGINSF